MADPTVQSVELDRSLACTEDSDKRTYTDIYLVTLTGGDLRYAAQVARDAALSGGNAIPDLNDAYGNDATAKVRTKSVENRDENARVFEVTVRYETPTGYSWPTNPLNEEPRVAWGFANYMEPAEADVETGLPIKNSAKDPYNPPATRPHSRLTVTITRNEASWDGATSSSFWG